MFKKLHNGWKRFEDWANEDDSAPKSTAQTSEVGAPAPTQISTEDPLSNQAESITQDVPESRAEAYCYTNKTTTSPYKYTPLPSTSKSTIRVLTLLPGDADHDIECQLNELDLNSPRTDDEENKGFEALSYVWGDISNKTPIQIDGATIKIGRSLRSALLHLRYLDKPRILWTDAVCINQEDKNEPNSQVPLMGEIYTKAARTLVWLGCPCCLLGALDTDRLTYFQGKWPEQQAAIGPLFEAIKILGNEARKLAEEGREVVPKQGDKDEDGTTYDKIQKLKPKWNLILLENSWWTRIWTLQEIVLAKEARLCMYNQELDWDLLCDALPYYTALGFADFSEIYAGSKANSGVEPLNLVNSIREARQPGSELVTGEVGDELLHYLASSHWRDGKEPHDKIYALLGLFNKGRDLGIKVDYRLDPGDVYRSATKALLQRSGNLDALGFCYPFEHRKVANLPSWIPDWGSAGNLALPLMNDAKGNPRTTHASKRLRSNPRWENNDKTLILDGHIIDTISKIGSAQVPPRHDDRNEGSLDHMLNDPTMIAEAESFPERWEDLDPDRPIRHLVSSWWKGMKMAVPYLGKAALEVFGNIVEMRETFLEWEELVNAELNETDGDRRVIFRDSITTATPCPLEPAVFESRFDGWHQAVYSIRKLKNKKLDRYAPKTYTTLSAIMSFVKMEDDDLPEAFAPYTTHTSRRRLGITTSKRVCLLPKLTEVGDKVVLLRGGRVPMILRPRDDGSMQFIGEAYVHGVMDGEAFNEEECVDFRIT
ncbi:heterokaryon incompatibility protein-domain-containing protein [Cercophora samala]|uniref:Heterokaryon incompatibility protein-domain-containing protein n=1 Tax=Cercophora samala TaxID=330535 RepID=A0AA39Z969_9PEZI|nr:heterokaryon incompatibility protein-domain-containing protein [Cercophora samala]